MTDDWARTVLDRVESGELRRAIYPYCCGEPTQFQMYGFPPNREDCVPIAAWEAQWPPGTVGGSKDPFGRSAFQPTSKQDHHSWQAILSRAFAYAKDNCEPHDFNPAVTFDIIRSGVKVGVMYAGQYGWEFARSGK